MCSILFNFLFVYLLTLFIFHNNVICLQNNGKDYIDYNITNFEIKNDTKSAQSFNVSDDYSNDDLEEDNNEKSFMDRFKFLHKEGKNVPFSKIVITSTIR